MIEPTRMNLILMKNRLNNVIKSSNILDMKRKVLLDRFFKYLDKLKKEREEENKSIDRLYEAYFNASAFLSSFRLIQLAYIINSNVNVDYSIEKLMGVSLPNIKSEIISKYKNLLFESLSLDDIYDSYYNMFNITLKYAENEYSVRELALELDKVKRRMNALRYIVEPTIRKNIKIINEHLEEIEKSDFYMRKHIKNKLERNKSN